MLDFGFYNMDCMEGMSQFPDKYFDLAIVDPPYGIGVGSMAYTNGVQMVGNALAKRTDYSGHKEWDSKPQRKNILMNCLELVKIKLFGAEIILQTN